MNSLEGSSTRQPTHCCTQQADDADRCDYDSRRQEIGVVACISDGQQDNAPGRAGRAQQEHDARPEAFVRVTMLARENLS
jgi:hypothetical protein